jgi:hypothetical protein
MVARPIPWCARDGHRRVCRALARPVFVICEAYCLDHHYRRTGMCIAGQHLRQLFGRGSRDPADRQLWCVGGALHGAGPFTATRQASPNRDRLAGNGTGHLCVKGVAEQRVRDQAG